MHEPRPCGRQTQREEQLPEQRKRWYRRATDAVQLRLSARKERLERVPLGGIDAQPVFQLDLDHPLRKPRAVSGRHPFGRVPVTFLRPVHRRIRDREVVEVTGNVPAPLVGEAAVVRLRQRHDVLDVRRRGPGRRDVEREARVRGVDLPVRLHRGRQRRDDLVLQAAVARPESVAVVAVPRSLIADLQPAPRLRVRRAGRRLHRRLHHRRLRLYIGDIAGGVVLALAVDAVVVVVTADAREPFVDHGRVVRVVTDYFEVVTKDNGEQDEEKRDARPIEQVSVLDERL